LFLCVGAALVIQPAAHADEYGDITAVSSMVRADYVRAKLANGAFAPETYAFGEGGLYGGPMGDTSIDRLKFLDVAKTIAAPLAGQSYVPARDPKETKLLIMVYWGTTAGASGAPSSAGYQNAQSAASNLAIVKEMARAAKRPGDLSKGPGVTDAENVLADAVQMVELENKLRDQTNLQTARLLGYNRTGLVETDYGRGLDMTALRFRRRELIDDIEDDRYFVVLLAYDFQQLWKQKKRMLLWETRYSIRQRHNDFDKVLADMTQYASKYFGQDSHGLIRKPLPEGHVTVGETKVIEIVPGK
jgi:hypothetical protein